LKGNANAQLNPDLARKFLPCAKTNAYLKFARVPFKILFWGHWIIARKHWRDEGPGLVSILDKLILTVNFCLLMPAMVEIVLTGFSHPRPSGKVRNGKLLSSPVNRLIIPEIDHAPFAMGHDKI
jgi:hypothetical protein